MRRQLYEYVAAAHASIGRGQASAALGIGRPLAAFHLDQLVRDGLLVSEYRRLTGRTGPGSGHRAKLYRRAPGDAVSLPPRDYEIAADVFAAAFERLDPVASAEVILGAARERGRRIGEAAIGDRSADRSGETFLVDTLDRLGFEATLDGDLIRLHNCPFDALARRHRDLTCPANLALLDGLIAGLGATAHARPWPEPGFCCVAVERRAASGPERRAEGTGTDS